MYNLNISSKTIPFFALFLNKNDAIICCDTEASIKYGSQASGLTLEMPDDQYVVFGKKQLRSYLGMTRGNKKNQILPHNLLSVKQMTCNTVHCESKDIVVQVKYLKFTRSVIINADATVDDLFNDIPDVLEQFSQRTYLSYHDKPLRGSIPLREYNIHDGSILNLNECLLGGSILLPTYSHVRECEIMVTHQVQIQSADDEDDSWKNFDLMFRTAMKNSSNLLPSLENDWLMIQVENFSQVLHWSQKCTNFSDYVSVTQLAYRLFTGDSLGIVVRDKLDKIFQPNVQSFDIGETLKILRGAFDTTSQIQESPLMRKLVSLYSFLLTQGFLKHFGIDLSDEDYSKIEQRAMLSAYSSKKAFFMCVLDTVLFICEKIHEWRSTGDITTFLHSSDEYAKWLKEADRILNLAPFVGNLEAHGTSYFSFLSNLKDCIEKGEAYAKFTKSTAGVDSVYIKRKLNCLQLLLNTEVTRRAAQQERIQPMGVLVYGSSSIAKSAFTKMLFNYYGGLFDLERDDQYRYVRNPMDEYWSNFDSSKWCIQLDDIAFRNPTKCAEVDSTLQDLLNVVNNVPYVPPQAALEDKGKTPVMARLVVATTNCINLNAQEYFWCPLAVRRRLPFVISVKPKKEFLHENKIFIDPAKLSTEEGVFPDFWEITVSKIVPVINGRREDAELKEIAVFSEVSLFLQFFGKACLLHEQNQKKAMAKDDDMLKIQVCKECLKPLPHEVCLGLQYGVVNVLAQFWVSFLAYFIKLRFFMRMLECVAYYRSTRFIAVCIMNSVSDAELSVRFFGRLNAIQQDPRLKKLVLCISLLGAGFATYFYVHRKFEKKEKVVKKAPENSVTQVQGNVFGTTEDQLSKETKSNVWYNPSIELTSFDIPPASASLANAGPDEIRNLFAKNCVLLHIRMHGDNATRIMRGTFLRGHQCVTNAHAFKDREARFTVTVIQQSVATEFNANVSFDISGSDIAFDQNNDLCVFDVTCLPPFKDISKFWVDTEIFPSSALELMRMPDGTVAKNSIFALSLIPKIPISELKGEFDVYFGKSTLLTEVGMCGSLCVATTPRGPILFGIHILGGDHSIGIHRVTLTHLNDLCKQKCILSRPIVQGGGSPMLSCPGKNNVVTIPHHKSMFRYMETGALNVYGSFAGFRPKPKSSVCATPLQSDFLEHFGTNVEYGQPVMSGWEPWRNNVIEMIKPNSTYKRSTLSACVEGFTQDILRELPQDWEKELVPLSDLAAVNGLPGVIYIDKIATNTSMGFPWACSKKKYLHSHIDEVYSEGVDFDIEIWDRVREIERNYAEGRRAYPVFTGHLKDEALPLKKIEVKKTRMFTGSPVDWNIVVRKRLLSFVRLLQKNKFVFEAGPGTVAQSAEWGKVYDYLTVFGTDRIIAGDYGKFDKRMLSDFILAAFEIIANILRAAGYSENECREVMCIGEDVAFPLTNVNGDLVEFFGTNPSGHPLTVIINSLVNSLYMRYCFLETNPEREVRTFKERVHLFTYGDDNIMGVHRTVPWFNHTAIKEILADIGVEYTMADKESLSIPFISIFDCSFLKRKWVWMDDVNNWVCPLEEASIVKSLTMWVPSKSIDKFAQMVNVIQSANNEYFYYGREIFEQKRALFVKLLEQHPYAFYVTETTLPTFEQLVERFLRA